MATPDINHKAAAPNATPTIPDNKPIKKLRLAYCLAIYSSFAPIMCKISIISR